MIESTSKALTLLERCDATARMQARDPNRMAEMIAEHRLLREELRQQLQIQEGFVAELHRVISKVFALLGTVYGASNGRLLWAEEIGTHKAPHFRRELNGLVRYINEIRESPEHEPLPDIPGSPVRKQGQ